MSYVLTVKINVSPAFFLSNYAILKMKNPGYFQYVYSCETKMDFNGNNDVICNSSQTDDVTLVNRNEEATFECFAHDKSSVVNQFFFLLSLSGPPRRI